MVLTLSFFNVYVVNIIRDCFWFQIKDYDAVLDIELDSMDKFVLQCLAFYQVFNASSNIRCGHDNFTLLWNCYGVFGFLSINCCLISYKEKQITGISNLNICCYRHYHLSDLFVSPYDGHDLTCNLWIVAQAPSYYLLFS